jgi:nucleotide-binding universal stress UspA family protein
MKKILCQADASENSNHAVHYAARYASANNASLTLSYAEPILDALLDLVPDKAVHSLENSAKSLEILSHLISRKYFIACSVEKNTTVPPQASFSIENKLSDYDLVIVGTNVSDTVSDYTFGDKAYDAVVRSQVPLLVIPSNCEYRALNNFAYAFDYSQKKRLPLKQLKQVIPNTTPVTVLQILNDVYNDDEAHAARELEKHLLQHNKEMLKSFATVWSPDVASAIGNYVFENSYDALGLCTLERNFLEGLFHKSVIKELCATARCPVYIFHE